MKRRWSKTARATQLAELVTIGGAWWQPPVPLVGWRILDKPLLRSLQVESSSFNSKATLRHLNDDTDFHSTLPTSNIAASCPPKFPSASRDPSGRHTRPCRPPPRQKAPPRRRPSPSRSAARAQRPTSASGKSPSPPPTRTPQVTTSRRAARPSADSRPPTRRRGNPRSPSGRCSRRIATWT